MLRLRSANMCCAIYQAPVAQLDRASVFGTEGWGFESLRAYHSCANAQPSFFIANEVSNFWKRVLGGETKGVTLEKYEMI